MRGDCPDDVVGVCGDFGGHDDLHALDQGAGEHAWVVEFWGGICRGHPDVGALQPEPVGLEFVRLDDDHVVGVAEEHVGHQEGFRPGDVEFWLAGPFHCCGCRLALHPQHSCNRSNAGVGEVHAPPPGGGQHVDDSHRPGHVPDALPAPGFSAASPPPVCPSGRRHRPPRFFMDEPPHQRHIMGDHGAAIYGFAQCLQDGAE